tara:strand:+ start:197 stop:1048 length:852 start_codon:yes stop_codon:yes gene_type:complete
MIIWLASYPKSGNTWIRSFISALLYTDKGQNDFSNLKKIKQFPARSQFKDFVKNLQNIEEIYKNWEVVQNFINLDKEVKFLKTHHVNCIIEKYKFSDEKNTLGAIHIVRDPRNVLLSIKNHFSLSDNDEALKFISKEKHWVGIEKKQDDKFRDNMIPTLISSWNIHYQTWRNKTKNYLLIKYEDLQENPTKEFQKIIDYLEKVTHKKFDDNKIIKAIETTSFKYMQNLEDKGYFSENARGLNKNEVKFFNLGPKNDWKKLLNNEIIKKINLKFNKEMKELGYL